MSRFLQPVKNRIWILDHWKNSPSILSSAAASSSQLMRFSDGLALQEHLLHRSRLGSAPTDDGYADHYVLMLQHRPTYTAGRRLHSSAKTVQSDINLNGADYCNVPRGGELTYHGPGQLVVYFILDLTRLNLSSRCFVDCLERLMVKTCTDVLSTHLLMNSSGTTSTQKSMLKNEPSLLKELNERYRIRGGEQSESKSNRNEAGLWVNDAKLGSVGIHLIRHHVPGDKTHQFTSHGISFNIYDTVIPWFNQIAVCGIRGRKVGSFEQLVMNTKKNDDDESYGTVSDSLFQQCVEAFVRQLCSPRTFVPTSLVQCSNGEMENIQYIRLIDELKKNGERTEYAQELDAELRSIIGR